MPVRTEVVMGTLVTIHVIRDTEEANAAIGKAFGWFHEVERRCSRFLPGSELVQLSAQWGAPVTVSPVLFEAVQFALSVAEETGGAFDPAIGRRMELRGFNREHRTGETIATSDSSADATWRDIHCDSEARTITLDRPLTLDLGAVAKGLAVDTAAHELATFRDFAINAGGDLYFGGRNPSGEAWNAGISHPRLEGELIATLRVSGQAVCTSGDYERRAALSGNQQEGGHHILDPRRGESPNAVASATVIAPSAMLADALATAAFVLGPAEGIALLERMSVAGLLYTPDLTRYETRGLRFAA